MTPAERSLLLAVAEHVHRHVKAGLQQRENLFIAIAAVEAEAAFAADDEAELAEVAEKAMLLERCQAVRDALDGEAEVKSCETCRFDISICGYSTCVYGCGWGQRNAVCPTCNGLGFWLPSEPKQDTTCPTCEGNGKKEKTDDHT